MVVTDIMMNEKADPGIRLKATDQVFKVRGTYAAEKKLVANVNIEPRNSEELEELAKRVREQMRAELAK
jgi:heat shock protein HspQ